MPNNAPPDTAPTKPPVMPPVTHPLITPSLHDFHNLSFVSISCFLTNYPNTLLTFLDGILCNLTFLPEHFGDNTKNNKTSININADNLNFDMPNDCMNSNII